MAPVSIGLSLPDPPLPLGTNYRTFALLGSGGLWEALVGQEGVWGGFGEALGGFGEALGRLWEALGRLWGGFGKALEGFGEALGRLWEASVRPTDLYKNSSDA